MIKALGRYIGQKIDSFLKEGVDRLSSEDISLLAELIRTYLRRFRGQYILIFSLIGITSAVTALSAWLVKDVVNEIFVEGNAGLVVPLAVGVIVLFGVKGASTYYQTVLSRRISNAMVADIQQKLMDHIVRQRISFFNTYTSDTLLMRFNQGAAGFNSILNSVLVDGSRDLSVVIGLLIVMIVQDPILTVVSLLVSPIVFYGVTILLRKMKSLVQLELAGFEKLNQAVREAVQGVTVIKAFNLENIVSKQGGDVIDGLRDRADRIAALQSAPIPLLDTVGGIAVGLAILYAGLRTATGGYDPGTFASFLTALLLAADPARRLSQLRITLRTGLVMVQAVFAVLNDDQSEPTGPRRLTDAAAGPDRPPRIRFDDVRFAYDGTNSVLDGFSLDVAPGEIVALVGPSGAGKSTVFNLLLKFHVPTSGTIRLNDADIADVDTADLRRIIGYVGQSNFIFNGSLRDNLALNNDRVTDAMVEAASEAVGLRDHIDRLPQRYDTSVGELGAMISGGQAQRLNVARAILKDPPVLLLDEVTSALDAENEQLIKTYIHEKTGNKTVLVIAHRLSTIREADRIVVLKEGQILAVGRHDDLFENNDYYRKIVSLQII